MRIFFSKASGFQLSTIHSSINPDAIEITEDVYNGLLRDQSDGKFLDVVDGKVVSVAATPTIEDMSNMYMAQMNVLVNREAKALGFTDQFELLSYVDDDNPAYSEKARSFRSWRSKLRTWTITKFAEVIPTQATETEFSKFFAEAPSINSKF